MRLTTALTAAAVAVTALAGCGSTVKPAKSTAPPVGVASSIPGITPAPATTPAPVAAVPGTSGNEYKAGPFDVHLTKGITRLPARYDAVTEQGKDIPGYGSVVVVRNISRDFTGWVSPELEYVKGHSVKGEIVDTEAADPYAGSGGGRSDPLAPGQSETLYAQYQGSYRGYVSAQLIQVQYGAPGTGGLDATTVRLRY
jgi:hypothetical protein